MADENNAADAPADDAAAEQQQTMDDVIDAEAEKEALAEKTGEQPDDSDDATDGDADDSADDAADTEDDEQADEQADEELEDEEYEDEDDEEQEPVDTSQFSVGGLEAVPDDYKPENWKSFMNDIVDVVRGEVNREASAINEQQEAFQQEVAAVDEGWQSEIDELVKSGDIPKGKDQEKVVQEVFNYMAETNRKAGDNVSKQVWSFETAYKLMNANKVTDERKEEIKTRRRARAAATSGSSEGGSGIPRPTKGMSLDDIIEQEVGGY